MQSLDLAPSTVVAGCVVATSIILVLAVRAEATTVVSPPGFGLEEIDGNIHFFPRTDYPDSPGDVPASTYRFQELHPAAAFDALGTGPVVITRMAWRPDVSVNEPISDDWEFNLLLSATDVGALSLTFADNVGPLGETEVFSGIVRLQTDGEPRGSGLPHEFDYVIEFDTPFVYFPQNGDLLVDVVFEVPLDDPWIWVDADDRTGEYVEVKPLGPIADKRGLGLFVTEFTIIPSAGDFTGDGEITGDDFIAWQRGESPNPLSTEDLAIWKTNFASLRPGQLAGSAPVPEPAALVLLLCGVGTASIRRAGLATLIVLCFAFIYVPTAHAVTFDWATVGNTGNADDVHGDGFGGVDYAYRISKHEVTNAQYAKFLNAVASTGRFGGSDPTLEGGPNAHY